MSDKSIQKYNNNKQETEVSHSRKGDLYQHEIQ